MIRAGNGTDLSHRNKKKAKDMRLNKKMLAVTAVLAVGILAGCGSSGTAASTPASSAVPASSHVVHGVPTLEDG